MHQPISDKLKNTIERARQASNLKNLMAGEGAADKKIAIADAMKQMPLWREELRGMPNALARSSLFCVGNRKQTRTHFEYVQIATVGDISIQYTGQQLRQDDEDVWLHLIHLARGTVPGGVVEFTAYSMLKAIKWSTDTASYDRLKRCINRLSATTLAISNNNNGFGGSLIRKFQWRDEKLNTNLKAWKIWLEPEIITLFNEVSYTQLDWEQRLKLSPLAKWLHSFYFTHCEPYPYKVTTLKRLCGSETKTVFHFRSALKNALNELTNVGFISDWEIVKKSDLVT